MARQEWRSGLGLDFVDWRGDGAAVFSTVVAGVKLLLPKSFCLSALSFLVLWLMKASSS